MTAQLTPISLLCLYVLQLEYVAYYPPEVPACAVEPKPPLPPTDEVPARAPEKPERAAPASDIDAGAGEPTVANAIDCAPVRVGLRYELGNARTLPSAATAIGLPAA